MSAVSLETNRISLILGGARSGKSNFAEKLAHKRAGINGVLYVATLEPFDAEMQARVESHQAARPASWRTLEAPYNLATALETGWHSEKLALIDCLTVWTSNLLLKASGWTQSEILEDDISLSIEDNQAHQEQNTPPKIDYQTLEREIIAELTSLVQAARQQGQGLIMVSNEVGMGLVPPYPMGRAYRDMLGRVNQRVAALCDEVFMVLAGMAVDWKAFSLEV